MVWEDTERFEDIKKKQETMIDEKEEKKEEKKGSWLDDTQETIMIFGLPKHGKTFAYCSIIEHFINKGGNIYVISTDAGFTRTAKVYFGDKINDIHKKISVEKVYNISSVRNYYNEIKDDLKKDDLVCLDLCSDIWEWAQQSFVEKLSDGDVESFIYKAMKDPKSFGTLDSNKWNYIKALHKFVEDIIIRKPCNFVGVCNEKEVEVELIKGGAKAKQLMMNLGLSDLTSRPGGMKLLPYKFETIIRVGVENKKYFCQIIGDRGYKLDLEKYFYDRNLYKKLLEWREKQK